uniref:ClpB_D2-small domain-containing protein n=1 Tax=Panagrellus redivivus TaxID=6233 RepID=A0A7E4ZWK3_PANRE
MSSYQPPTYYGRPLAPRVSRIIADRILRANARSTSTPNRMDIDVVVEENPNGINPPNTAGNSDAEAPSSSNGNIIADVPAPACNPSSQ